MNLFESVGSAEITKAITLIKNNESYFEWQKEMARLRLDISWNEYTRDAVLRILDECSVFEFFKDNSITWLVDLYEEENEYNQEELQLIIELGESIKEYKREKQRERREERRWEKERAA